MTRHSVGLHTRTVAKAQRREPTQAERMLWRDLRGRRFAGFKIRRQVPVGPYVADFLSFERRLIIELDGQPHADPGQLAHDRRRDAWLRGQGFMILRFQNDLILGGSGDLVLADIERALDGPADPSSVTASRRHLLPQGEKGGAGPSPLAGEGGTAKP